MRFKIIIFIMVVVNVFVTSFFVSEIYDYRKDDQLKTMAIRVLLKNSAALNYSVMAILEERPDTSSEILELMGLNAIGMKSLADLIGGEKKQGEEIVEKRHLIGGIDVL